jgi:short-subunit dehydrogenase
MRNQNIRYIRINLNLIHKEDTLLKRESARAVLKKSLQRSALTMAPRRRGLTVTTRAELGGSLSALSMTQHELPPFRAFTCQRALSIFLPALLTLSWFLIDRSSHFPSLPDRCTILITGGSSGIGAHAAEAIARMKPNWVVIASVRSEDAWSAVLSKNLSNLRPLFMDVGQRGGAEEGAMKALQIAEDFGAPFAALVNNAGILRESTVEYSDMSDNRALFDVNVWGALELTQALLPAVSAAGGRVLFLSSVAGEVSVPLNGVYAASKAALEALTDALRREILHSDYRNVAIAIVQPAYVRSAIVKSALAASVLNPKNSLAASFYPHLYGAHKERKRRAVTMNAADPADTTTPAIIAALTDSRPKTRYQTASAGGLPASIIIALRHFLPTRLADYIITMDD